MSKGKRVVVRVDLNVPIANGEVTDATRIERVVPTIRELLDKGAAVIVLAHFDRPKGKVVPEMSLKPVAPALEKLLGRPVDFHLHRLADGTQGRRQARPMRADGKHPLSRRRGKERRRLSPRCWRASAISSSTTPSPPPTAPIPRPRASRISFRPTPAAPWKPNCKRPGTGARKARSARSSPSSAAPRSRPSSNCSAISSGMVDAMVIGGGMANTFLAAQGLSGRQVAVRARPAPRPRANILASRQGQDCAILLPIDVVVAKEFKADAPSRTIGVDAMSPPTSMILDVGPLPIDRVNAAFDDAHTLVWNGPLGAFEIAPFDAATVAVRAPCGSTAPRPANSSRSPAAATRCRPSITPAWPMTSPISQPPVAPSSNGSKASPCPASRLWRKQQ